MSDSTKRQHETVKGEFRKQAAGWGQRQDNLSQAAQSLDLQPHFTALDVATGSALFASAVAPHVRQVVAVDITPEMQAQARQRNIDNIAPVMAAAETLPHAADSFDRVVTRYSLHHLQQPKAVVAEIYRVCRPGGAAMIIDIVAPEDPAVAQRYNHLERLRDPSHTQALALSVLQEMMTAAGFNMVQTEVDSHSEMDAEAWFDLAQTGPTPRQQVLAALDDELQGGDQTGFNPFFRDDKLKFMHTISTVVGMK